MWEELIKITAKTTAQITFGYGSFFGLSHPLSRALLIICTMLHPLTGIGGVECAVMILVWRKLLSFPADGTLEIINGLLFGMLIGSLYTPGPGQLLVVSLGALLIVLSTACLQDTIGRLWRLPVLGLPYVLTGFLFIPIAGQLGMAPLPQNPVAQMSLLHMIAPPMPLDSPLNIFAPLGSLYFNGTPIGGTLVFVAFALSSRYLALLALAASIACALFLQLCPDYYGQTHFGSTMGILTVNPLPLLIAQMNGILTAGVIGGLYAVPSPRSILVALGSAIVSCIITIFFQHSFIGATLPPLALPFVLSIYLAVLALGTSRGGPWLRFWLLSPALPEQSLERLTIARARGLDLHSVALQSPVSGSWNVYQSFDGLHTHQGAWRYAIDLIQKVDGLSFEGEGLELTDYYSYGQSVLAPAWGTVAAMVNDCADNGPGEINLVNNWGNYLVITLDTGAGVTLAHLQKGSIRVALHQRVSPGQLLALVGNSGRSPQPHLHIHVQSTTGRPTSPGTQTIPFHFCNVIVEGTEGSAISEYQLNAVPKEYETLKSVPRNAALIRALHLPVGRSLDYVVDGRIMSLVVTVDIAGQFNLETKGSAAAHARVLFTASEDLLAFFERNSVRDSFLDLYALALGLTPMAEGNLKWRDTVPLRLLPASAGAKMLWSLIHPFKPCAESTYSRYWDREQNLWIQRGEHNLPLPFKNFRWQTEVLISESAGVTALSLVDGDGRLLLTARLAGYGIREDNGIPETTVSHR